MTKKVAVLPGDGGQSNQRRCCRLKAIGERLRHQFEFTYGLIGGAAIDEAGSSSSRSTIETCNEADAVLLGSVGGPKWDRFPSHLRPEKGLLAIRKELDLYANLRPVTFYDSLADASPLKKEYIEGVDFIIVRELTGGLYFGKPSDRRTEGNKETVVDTLFYKRTEIERIIASIDTAVNRRKKVTSVDKANVLESSRVWREVAEEVAKDYPDVELEHMLVDSAAMQLIRNPKYFDVVVTENMFGDILSDEASMLTGSLGMLPSASLTADGPSLYEPVHGSAPDIAGQNKANPIAAAILSAAMLLRHSFGLEKEAAVIEQAVESVLHAGHRTADLADGNHYLGTDKMVEVITAVIANDSAISSIMTASR
nr:3-isopropylmalat-dehydrogenase [Priestia megaterium DSM 319]prf//2109196A 3-isopropylmalate dehydrogenase [Priestia megaterium]